MANFAVNLQQLGQLLHLLEMAQSQDNSAQSEVFHALKSIEERSISYLYLAFILANQTFPLPLRTIAGLTLSSFLKRNKRTLHFQPTELNQMKAMLLAKRESDLDRVRSMVISEMISRHDFDFQLFGQLVQGVQICRQNVAMVNIILQDIRFNNENYNIFEDDRFWHVTQSLYQKVIPLIQQQLPIASPHLKDYIKCLNLLTFHCPNRLYPYLTNYINAVIQPVLQQANSLAFPSHTNSLAFPSHIVQLCLEGVNEIIATKCGLVPQDLLWIIVNFNGSAESQKIWSNIMIDMVENQTDTHFQKYLSVILPKAVQGLTFTPHDERNIKEEMQIQYNPYGEGDSGQQEQEDETQILQASYGSTSGYTLRKLSFQLIQKISVHYSQGLWSQWAHFIGTRLRNQNPAITETAISFIGIIAQTCMYDMGEDLQQSIPFLLQKASSTNCTLVRATSLWALEKLLPAFKDYDSIVGECLGLVFEGVKGQSVEGTHTTHLMLKEAGISLLDQILSLQNMQRVATPQVLQQIVNTLLQGLNMFKGRALFSIFKAHSTIFESEYFRSVIPEATCSRIVAELCRKWTVSLKSDSIVCPLLECLITAYQAMQPYLSKFNHQFFAQLVLLLRNKDRKQLVLRCIDFLSSIITTAHPNLHQSVTSNEFIDLVSSLAVSEEKEIRHFVYILISDIAKNYDISLRVEQLVLLVAQTMDQKSLTSRNNAFMCLTDLLEKYPTLAKKYLAEVFSQVAAITKTEQQMNHVYAFNFARMLGRLSLMDAQQGKRQITLSPNLVQFIFLSLRTRQVTKATSDSFRGMLNVLSLMNVQQIQPFFKDLQCVLQALVCYPVRRQEDAQNQATVMLFSKFTKQLRSKLGQQLWSQILQRPIFLPAAIRTLNTWCIQIS